MNFFLKKLKNIKDNYMENRRTRRGSYLMLLWILIFAVAVFQFFQLRRDYIHEVEQALEMSGQSLENLLTFEQQQLKALADNHMLTQSHTENRLVGNDMDTYLNIDTNAKGFQVNRVNPFVPFNQMGVLFGLHHERFIESDYRTELNYGLKAMEKLDALLSYDTCVDQTYYFSFKGFMALKPWFDIDQLMQTNQLTTYNEVFAQFDDLIHSGPNSVSVMPFQDALFNKSAVLVLNQIVQVEEYEIGSYGVILNLSTLNDKLYQSIYDELPLYLIHEDRKLVRWNADDQIETTNKDFVNHNYVEGISMISKKFGSFDSVYCIPGSQYGIGVEVNEWFLFKKTISKMWTYIGLVLCLSLIVILMERSMYKRYYKPATILTQLLNGEISQYDNLDEDKMGLWRPIYQRILEYSDLISISDALPGAMLQVVKAKDKYVVKYYTQGLHAFFPESENFQVPKGTDFLRLFDANSYWNLENLLRDSTSYMIPIAYEACLNTDKSENTYVNVLLEPRRAKDESVYWEGIIINVTDRKVLQQELNEEKRFIEKLFNLSGALFAVLDLNMAIVRCNQSFQQMFPSDPVINNEMSLFQLFTEFDYINFKDRFNEILNGTPNAVFEHYWVLPDGRKKLVKTSIAPLLNLDEKIEFVVLTAIDISDRYKIEEELKKTNQSLYFKNSQVERSARIQRELFKTFEDLRNAETIKDIFRTLSKVVSQIASFHNFLVALKPNKQQVNMDVVDIVQDFSGQNYSHYFHYHNGTLGRVLNTRIPYMTGNITNDPDYVVHDEFVKSVIYIPITYNNFLWGILGINSYVENAFSKMDFEILNVLGSHLGLYMEELHNRTILKEEADRLRGLHHVIQDISALRNNDEIAQKIVENGLLKYLAIFKTSENDNYELIAESKPSSYEMFGIMPNYAILDHSLSKNKMINGRIGTLNVYHLANPVTINGKTVGILYSIKEYEFTEKDEELILIISEQMAVFWRLNDMIEKANYEALVDPLTSIWNRRYMIDRLTEENHRNNRYNSPASIAIIDLGNFKAINDKYGHNAGDEVLVEIAVDFNLLIRESDFAGRYGGDEFIIYMPSTTRDQGLSLMNRIANQIEGKKYSQHALSIFIDFGLATVPEDSNDIFEALKIADERMYTHKNNRKVASGS